MKRTDKWIVYVFCVLNSISGLRIGGVALNTVFVGLFMAFIIAVFLRNARVRLRIKKRDTFIYYLLAAALSCILSCMYTYILPHVSIVSNYLINCIMYMIMYLLMSNMRNDIKTEILESFYTGLIYAARIQAVWGIIQLGLLYSAGININKILFVDILHSTNTRDWIMGFYSGNVWNMRITGLNFENSMFALVVCIGMALEKNYICRVLLMITAILSLSRTGWIMVAGYIVVIMVRRIKKSSISISKKKMLSRAGAFIGLIIGLIVLYNNSAIMQRQVRNILFRLTDSAAMNVSASRHLLYYPYGVSVWFTDANILQKLIGYGMRVSGIAFNQNPDVVSKIGIHEAFTSAWAVECDVIGLLLGGGLVVFVLYYATMFKLVMRKDNILRDALIIILMGGVSYHYHTISYVVFAIMVASSVYLEGYRKS